MADKEKEPLSIKEQMYPDIGYCFADNKNIAKYYNYPEFMAQIPNPYQLDLARAVDLSRRWWGYITQKASFSKLDGQEAQKLQREYRKTCFIKAGKKSIVIRTRSAWDISSMRTFFDPSIAISSSDLLLYPVLIKGSGELEINGQEFNLEDPLPLIKRLQTIKPGDEINIPMGKVFSNQRVLALPKGFRIPKLRFIGPKTINGEGVKTIKEVFEKALTLRKPVECAFKSTHSAFAKLILSQTDNLEFLTITDIQYLGMLTDEEKQEIFNDHKVPIFISSWGGQVDLLTAMANDENNEVSRIGVGLDVIETGKSLKRLSKNFGLELTTYQDLALPCYPVLITYQPN